MSLLSASLGAIASRSCFGGRLRENNSFLSSVAGRRIRPDLYSLPTEERIVVRCLALFSVIALFAGSPFLPQDSSSTAKPDTFSVPPDIAAKTNPVHATPAALAQAKKMYGYDCAMCHGANGAGDGDMAADLKTKLKDYRDPNALKGMSDGELFYIIQKGKGEMPGEGDREKPEDLWTMVSLVRSFSKK